VEKCGTAVHATADNITRRMRLTRSVTAATDRHSQYVMLTAVGYMTALNVTLQLHCCWLHDSPQRNITLTLLLVT